jgi:hypothetical protein
MWKEEVVDQLEYYSEICLEQYEGKISNTPGRIAGVPVEIRTLNRSNKLRTLPLEPTCFTIWTR